MLCRRLRPRVYQIIRKNASPQRLEAIRSATGLSVDRIIMTKCGFVCLAMKELLNFRNPKEHPIDEPLSSSFGYFFDLEGITRDGRHSGTDHEFIVLYGEESWWIVDSYLGCRDLTCRRIAPEELMETVRSLSDRFNEDLWIGLTGCPSTDEYGAWTSRMQVNIQRFNLTWPSSL